MLASPQVKVSEAMKWLEDEKEARSYLHSLANKMHDELDGLRTATIRVSVSQSSNFKLSLSLSKIIFAPV